MELMDLFFFKRKRKEKRENVEKPKKDLDKTEILEEINRYKVQLETTDSDKKNDILNNLGKLYFEIGDIDEAINYYEQSISEDKQLGQAYRDLIKLYNIKRQEAVSEGNESKVQFYLEKIDSLLKLSKDVIRGRV